MNDEQILKLAKTRGIEDDGRTLFGYGDVIAFARALLSASTASDKQVAKLCFLLRTNLARLDDETLTQLDVVERSLEQRRLANPSDKQEARVRELEDVSVIATPPLDKSASDALCEHEWQAMTEPHKECVKCGDVRRDWDKSASDAQPIYQIWANDDRDTWIDVEADDYRVRVPSERRIVYIAAPRPAAQDDAWDALYFALVGAESQLRQISKLMSEDHEFIDKGRTVEIWADMAKKVIDAAIKQSAQSKE